MVECLLYNVTIRAGSLVQDPRKNWPEVEIYWDGWQNARYFVGETETECIVWEKRLNASKDAKTI